MRNITTEYPPFITHDNVEEFEVHRFSVEASTLGLKVGDWPLKLETNMGNGEPFYMTRTDETPCGDLAGVRYMQGNGILSLLIIND